MDQAPLSMQPFAQLELGLRIGYCMGYYVVKLRYYAGAEYPHTNPKRKRGAPRLRFGLVWGYSAPA